MLDLLLKRDPSVDGVTMGRLFVDGSFECYTLEDPIRDHKIAHETAIPAGRYRVIITKSQRFGRMLPLLLDVPGFDGIRIHPGNTTADTSGCILVGRWQGVRSVLNSRLAMERLQPQIAQALAEGDDVWITIENARQVPEQRA